MTSPAPHWVTVKDAAERAEYSTWHVRRLAEQGTIAAQKLPGGREWQIDLVSLLEYKARYGRAPKGSAGSKGGENA